MARDYAIVLPSFWTGATGRRIRALGRDAQVVAAYLVTSPHANMIGLYHLPIAYLEHDTGVPREGASRALQGLGDIGFAHYDADAEVVWVPEMARYQIVAVGKALKPTDLRCKGVANELLKYRKTRFYHPFVEHYRDVFHLSSMPPSEYAAAGDTEGPSKGDGSQDQDQDHDQDQRSAHTAVPHPEVRPTGRISPLPRREELYAQRHPWTAALIEDLERAPGAFVAAYAKEPEDREAVERAVRIATVPVAAKRVLAAVERERRAGRQPRPWLGWYLGDIQGDEPKSDIRVGAAAPADPGAFKGGRRALDQ